SAIPTGPSITGEACDAGQGVTVVVDFTPAEDAYAAGAGEVSVGCATGEHASIADAAAAAGFVLGTDGGFLQTIDDIAPTPPADSDDDTMGYWGIYTSSANHLPDGPPAESWQYSSVGIDGGPAVVDSALLFQI